MSVIKWRVQWTLVSLALCASLVLFASCGQEQTHSAALSSSSATRPVTLSVATSQPSEGAVPAPVVVTRAVVDPLAISLGFTFPSAPTNDESKARPDTYRDIHNAVCIACHRPDGGGAAPAHKDSDTMHTTGVNLTCIDCHGGPGDRRLSGPAEDLKSNDPDLRAIQKLRDPNAQILSSDPDFGAMKRLAHVWPDYSHKNPIFATSDDMQPTTIAMIKRSPDFVRFVNPGDLRAARVACAGCHQRQVHDVPKSMMTHGAMLWGAALYNNGTHNRKAPIYGEFYTPTGVPARVTANPWPTVADVRDRGMLPAFYPLPRWEVSQPGNILRVFERGGAITPELGIPDPEEDNGHPDVKLSTRGFGTLLRTDPVMIGLQKTRLFDPTLNLPGTNDHPGDFRNSGCTACHVVYANDRNPVHSVYWAKYGNRGESFSIDSAVNPTGAATQPSTQPYDNPNDPTRPARYGVHPIKHVFVRNMPTSSCIVCHVHPGTNVLNSYLGYMWWDNETDGWFMYPKKQVDPTSEDEFKASEHNPEAAAARGLWSNLHTGMENHRGMVAGPDFLEETSNLNPKLEHGQFADFHGHGWVFGAVFKQDRNGNFLDYANKIVDQSKDTFASRMAQGVQFTQLPDKAKHPPANVPVHLKDIHLEKGMQCDDCHFSTDSHGDGNLYGETRNAVAVGCVDCHGSAEAPSPILSYFKADSDNDKNKFLLAAFSGNAARAGVKDADVIARNKTMIEAHFNGDESQAAGTLVQKNSSYIQAQNLGATTGGPVDLSTMPEKWNVVQTMDTIKDGFKALDTEDDAEATRRGNLARYAHSVRKNLKWGSVPAADEKRSEFALAHSSQRVSCYACHSSWNTSCFGCHIPQRANQRKQMLHHEGMETRNYTNYNFQTLRHDIYMLCVDSTVRDHKVVPVRSACAVSVSSQNVNRDWIYSQQQTVSAEGFAGTAFSPNFPHTVRSAETKQCSDCHISAKNDNNAIMAQLLMQGTNAANFIGRYTWVAEEEGGLEAVAVTELAEPQAVIGSRLHEMAYPDNFRKFCGNNHELSESQEHHGHILDVQLRGEYCYTACGPEGFIAYDVANIENKDFSERIQTAPVSPLGQRFYVNSKYATSICSPSTMALDPARSWTKEDRARGIPGWRPENEEGKITPIGDRTTVLEEHRKIHPLYGFLYLTDREEGLIVIGNPVDDKVNGPGVTTLLDGNPQNNFLQRALTYNPGNLLHGAKHMALYGTMAYISCDAGLVVIDMDNPLQPRVMTVLTEGLNHPRKVQFQFRYGFVLDDDGMKVIDLSFMNDPRVIPNVSVPIADARDLYICRTYGYVAAGREGLIILDLKSPKSPKIDQVFNADGHMNDAYAVRVGITNTSLFAYVADGKNGLKVLQLTSPDDNPDYNGFSPRPLPRVIAHHHTHGPAVSLSKGLDRDRAVDESGNQLSVFGRRGARPFTLPEQMSFYFHNVPANGMPNPRDFYWVTDEPDNNALVK